MLLRELQPRGAEHRASPSQDRLQGTSAAKLPLLSVPTIRQFNGQVRWMGHVCPLFSHAATGFTEPTFLLESKAT